MPFGIHFDDAPNFYVENTSPGATSPPGPDDAGRCASSSRISAG